jgi:molybdenum cofactor biosynthesis protein B
VRVHILTVSTSRGPSEDASGNRLVELAQAAGHVVVGRSLVPDGLESVGAALDGALASDAEAVLLTGGTGISARDVTPLAVRARLDREIPGFGELFRMLSFEEVGAAAMLSSALAGVAAGRVVFALPGSVKACSLAMERLVLPELQHLVEELSKEGPLDAAPPQPLTAVPAPSVRASAPVRAPGPPRGPTLTVRADEPLAAPRPAAAPDAPLAGWQAGLAALGGTLARGAPFDPPERLPQGAIDVLASAGERAMLTTPDGVRWTVFGFPDLSRPAAKVLLVRAAEPLAEVVALHRWPARVGLCADDPSFLPARDALAGESAARCGAPCPQEGALVAVEAASLLVASGTRAARWDGRSLGEAAPTSSTIASLVLQWSQR